MKVFIFLNLVVQFSIEKVYSRPITQSNSYHMIPNYVNDGTKLVLLNENFLCDEICQRDFLLKYGYINQIDYDYNSDLTEGIFNLQKDAGIKETGIIDHKTFNLFKNPRCGVKWSQEQKKRFVILGKWNNPHNQYNEMVVSWYLDLSNYYKIQTSLSKDLIKTIFYSSLFKWSITSLLSFKEVQNEKDANITIKFLGGNHSDGFNFDGPGGILAHAFFPGSDRISGDVHLDLSEKWTLYNEGDTMDAFGVLHNLPSGQVSNSVSIFQVAIHEFGHSLGLGHSSNPESKMYGWYSPKNLDLHIDDILAINNLYGSKPFWFFK